MQELTASGLAPNPRRCEERPRTRRQGIQHSIPFLCGVGAVPGRSPWGCPPRPKRRGCRKTMMSGWWLASQLHLVCRAFAAENEINAVPTLVGFVPLVLSEPPNDLGQGFPFQAVGNRGVTRNNEPSFSVWGVQRKSYLPAIFREAYSDQFAGKLKGAAEGEAWQIAPAAVEKSLCPCIFLVLHGVSPWLRVAVLLPS